MKYIKNFDEWNIEKKLVDSKYINNEFSGREVWWVKFGVNIGSEQDGIGKDFERPIVIIKKFSRTTFLCAPLTTKLKNVKYRVTLSANDKVSYAIIDQLKVLDSRRLIRKIGKADSDEFANLKRVVKDIF